MFGKKKAISFEEEAKKRLDEVVALNRENLELQQQRIQQPVLVGAFCQECAKDTIHVSHIAHTAPAVSVPTNVPIKTCLSCGLTTYRML